MTTYDELLRPEDDRDDVLESFLDCFPRSTLNRMKSDMIQLIADENPSETLAIEYYQKMIRWINYAISK